MTSKPKPEKAWAVWDESDHGGCIYRSISSTRKQAIEIIEGFLGDTWKALKRDYILTVRRATITPEGDE